MGEETFAKAVEVVRRCLEVQGRLVERVRGVLMEVGTPATLLELALEVVVEEELLPTSYTPLELPLCLQVSVLRI